MNVSFVSIMLTHHYYYYGGQYNSDHVWYQWSKITYYSKLKRTYVHVTL